jgi:hypothetical protein
MQVPMNSDRSGLAARNRRTALTLASIALAFFVGFVLHYWLFR